MLRFWKKKKEKGVKVRAASMSETRLISYNKTINRLIDEDSQQLNITTSTIMNAIHLS